MYLRFVITQIDQDSCQPQGLFVASDALLKSSELDVDEKERLQEVLIWFNTNLPAPSKPYITGNVTFWFKTSAQEHIRRMWELVHILRAHGHLVEVHKREYLYDLVYWDDYQVAARFSRADGKLTIKSPKQPCLPCGASCHTARKAEGNDACSENTLLRRGNRSAGG